MPRLTAHHIRSIHLRRVFGRYTYDIPRSRTEFADVNILYGENGLGKTTLLNLVFHLLSPAPDKGHKDYLSTVPFERIEVVLQDGTSVMAVKDAQILTGPTTFSIRSRSSEHVWRYLPNVAPQYRIADLPENVDIELLPSELREEVKRSLAQRDYFKALAQLKVTPVMLTSDRILLADIIESDRRRRNPGQLPDRTLAEAVTEQRRVAVTHALRKASEWLQEKFFSGTYSVSSVSYESVVNRIASTPYTTRSGFSRGQELEIKARLTTKIQAINEKSIRLQKIGIGGFGLSQNLLSTIQASGGNKLHLIDNVLTPHLDELMQRVEILWPFLELVERFTSIINRFFRDKRITYAVFEGLKIVSEGAAKDAELQPQHLSSGEQQLMLIFCYVLTSRDHPGIFIIDEPEISLNILWQRMLVSSLEELAGSSECQFLFASHSMEILAKHSDRVLEMEDA